MSSLPTHARGSGGADAMTGGAAVDTADYSGSTGRVTVSLMSGNGWHGHASGDSLIEMENVVGSAFDDSLKGTTGVNRLQGGPGNDTLDGQAGDDVLRGTGGANRVEGGAWDDRLEGLGGNDVFGFGNDVIADFVAGAGIQAPISKGDDLPRSVLRHVPLPLVCCPMRYCPRYGDRPDPRLPEIFRNGSAALRPFFANRRRASRQISAVDVGRGAAFQPSPGTSYGLCVQSITLSVLLRSSDLSGNLRE
ncbi:hypothetical protein ABIE65_005560 [Constrictibacter sp. MBR-5]|jgi:hypothetical protein|uniref:calcium-binding protein n=1 Tax=Constrictibacter sp. MBR-5 TaxID=3156467 RepID=UPI003397DBC5